jgi:hypothetical protein
MSPPQMLQICLINSCVGRLIGLYFCTVLLYTTGWKASNVQERPFVQFTFYIVVVSPEDCCNFPPKPAVYVINNWMAEHLWCVERVTIENVDCTILIYFNCTLLRIFLSDQRFTVTLSAADLKVCNAVFSDFLSELLGTWDFPFYASVIFFLPKLFQFFILDGLSAYIFSFFLSLSSSRCYFPFVIRQVLTRSAII